MIMRVLLLVPLLAGSVSVVYCACIAATGRLLGSPLWSPAVAYASALPCVVLAAASLNRPQPGAVEAVARFVWKRPWKRWTALTGGLLGAGIGIAVAFVPPRIGLGPFFVLFVAGQVITAFVLDRVHESVARGILGNLAVILGATIFQCRSLQTLTSIEPSTAFICLAIAFTAGTCAVMQGAANSNLSNVLNGSFMTTAVYSFGSGLCILALAAYALQPDTPKWESIRWQHDWWKLFGGVLAISSMLTMTLMPRFLGFGLTTSWMVAGELITSLLVDHFGWLDFRQNKADMLRILGVVVVLVGVISLHMGDLHLPARREPASFLVATKEHRDYASSAAEATTEAPHQVSTPLPGSDDDCSSPFRSAAGTLTARAFRNNVIDV